MNQINTLRDAHQAAKRELVSAQRREEEARMALVRAVYPEGTHFEGTETADCTDGGKIKFTVPYTYKILVKDDDLDDALIRIPDHIKGELIKQEPKLNVRVYRTLSIVHKKIVDKILEIRPGKVQIKVE